MDEEFRKTLAVPTVLANRVYVSRGEGAARIAFGEAVDGEIFYRTAVQLSIVDTIALRDLLERILTAPDAPEIDRSPGATH
jgi:hypothetical protein